MTPEIQDEVVEKVAREIAVADVPEGFKHSKPQYFRYFVPHALAAILAYRKAMRERGVVEMQAKILLACCDEAIKDHPDSLQEVYHLLLHEADPEYLFHFEHNDHFYEWKQAALAAAEGK